MNCINVENVMKAAANFIGKEVVKIHRNSNNKGILIEIVESKLPLVSVKMPDGSVSLTPLMDLALAEKWPAGGRLSDEMGM